MARVRQIALPWNSQPQGGAEKAAPGARCVYLVNYAASVRGVAAETSITTLPLPFTSEPATDLGSLYGRGVVGAAPLVSLESLGAIPNAELNSLFASSGEASAVAVCRAAGTGGHGTSIKAICALSAGGSNNHYPFTDGKVYIGPFSSVRYVSAATVTGIDKPHVLVATHKSGAQASYLNGALLGTGTAAETPQVTAGISGIGTYGAIYAIALFDKVLSALEIATYTADPWRLFAPRQIYVPMPGAGSIPTLSTALLINATSNSLTPRVSAT